MPIRRRPQKASVRTRAKRKPSAKRVAREKVDEAVRVRAQSDAKKHAKDVWPHSDPLSRGVSDQEERVRRQDDEGLYRILAEAIPQIVWTSDPDGYNDYFNQRWFEYTGFSEEETYGGTKSALHPDDVERYNRLWSEAIRTGDTYEIEYRFRRASDGMYRWHLGRALPVRDESGTIIKWFGTCTDIDDQKRAAREVQRINQELERRVRERTLELEQTNEELEQSMLKIREAEEKDRASLERLRSTINGLPMGAIVADERGIVLHLNDKFCELFDLEMDAQALVGRTDREVVELALEQVANRAFYDDRVTKTMADAKPQLNQEVILQSGRILSRDYLPILSRGTMRGHLFLYRDITQEKRIDAAKSEFMSLASHQLRTPLTTMRWALGTLGRREQDDGKRRTLELARDAAIRMAESINTMLTIAALEAKKMKIQPAPLVLSDFLGTLRDESLPLSSEKSQELLLDCDAALEAHTDERLLREVLRNLLVNAIKYTPEGGRIALRARRKDDAVVIEVQDNGYGIPGHQQRKIFSKFFRGENIMEKDTKGTGLGLYLVRLLVELLGGEISFQSTEDEGTVFQIKLRS